MAETIEVVVKKPRLHVAQKEVCALAKRFNVLDCGRRWGKSKLGVRLAMDTILAGGPVGYFVPTYTYAEEFWDEIKERLEPIITYRNESKYLLRFATGGSLKVWSLEKLRAGRGKKYKRVIIDEAAFAKNLKESWEKSIRPTLIDLQGDAWFLSTPYGTANYFKSLFDNELMPDMANWKSFQMPTHTNPYIPPEELEELKKQFDDLTYQQEIMAVFVDYTARPFAYSFDPAKHVREFKGPAPGLPLYLSFDFNVDPITCIVSQHNGQKIRIHQEYRLENSDIYALCERIRVDWPPDQWQIFVTGDASGAARSGLVKDNMNYYKIIKTELGLTDSRFKLPKANPYIANSRVLTNSIFSRHPSVYIHPRCRYLIEDLKFVEVDEHGDINKTKDARRTHLLDCLRYYFNSFHGNFLKLYNRVQPLPPKPNTT